MEQQLVIFDLDGEHYGVNISSVEGIIKMQQITKIPKTPGFVEGIINLRGAVVPIINLRKYLGLPDGAANEDSRVVIVWMNGVKAGMVVDGVSEVLHISENTVSEMPPMISSVDLPFIRGIVKLEQGLITLLDLEHIFAGEGQSKMLQTVY